MGMVPPSLQPVTDDAWDSELPESCDNFYDGYVIERGSPKPTENGSAGLLLFVGGMIFGCGVIVGLILSWSGIL